MKNHNNKIYLNGQFLPLAEARISVMDRGFLFGDSIYEVIPAYAGRPFRLPQHLQRLNNSLRAIHITNPLQPEQWRSMLQTLIDQHPEGDQSVYLQVTRGTSVVRDHAIPKEVTPTVFAMATPIPPVDPRIGREGIAAITLDDIRWHLCNIKTTALLANVLLQQQAKEKKAMEAILVRDGHAMEGATSNLFIISNNRLVTPPKGHDLLPGVTRDLVLELVREGLHPSREAPIPERQLLDADEIWLTSSTKEIMPVTRLNGQPVGNGKPGAAWKRITQLYSDYKKQLKAEIIEGRLES